MIGISENCQTEPTKQQHFYITKFQPFIFSGCSYLLGGSKTVITADEGLRGSKKIALKNTIDSALENCNSVENVLVYQRTGSDIPMKHGRDTFLEEVYSFFCFLRCFFPKKTI